MNKEIKSNKDPLIETIEYYPMASRGCPFKCSIKGYLSWIWYVCTDKKSGKRNMIVSILDQLQQLRRIRFQDEIFPSKLDWIERFCDEYEKRVKLPFLCTFHPNTIKDEIVKKLKRVGLIVVGFGMQSPSERVRKEVF